MFGKLKEKLLKTASKITEKIYNKGEAEEVKEEKKEKPKISLTNLFRRESKKEEIKKEKTEPEIKKTEIVKTEIPKKVEEDKEEVKEIKEETEKKKISFFDRFGLTRAIKKVLKKEVVILEEDIEDVLEELEIELLEADVALEVVEKLIENIKNELVGRKISPNDNVEEITINAVKNAIKNILSQEKIDIEEIIKKNKAEGKPTVIVFVGINGTGKTTTIAKLAYKLKQKGYSVVLAAGDTFRAGAIEQLEQHAKNVGVKVIKHKQGADSAAVIYDAIQHAKARGIDVVLADTAGRQATNTNLMEEIKKVVRVTKPDLVIFVGDALTGNDAVYQAEEFNNAVNIDGIILTKVDADAKGGAALSIGYAIGKPILYLGVGQRYSDLIEFDADWMVRKLFGEEEFEFSTEREF
ncbi:signal recognition particle-docking protein FtsY [Methanocaldococcus bathoardescens]|uniref:Signal recognition particle receptor FtsY n=1 Tax=Methanocaldococcus bathoardescens TaxID=1301915 RepID=A0A076LC94_9EURY|nr:signal recognition particle-docking protein FtsY [Methanocaldococcus bathoardescens]AIJ06090.1 signal recognition particle-docking protein FtsY [Methanocaldococcus bathoardescens]